MQPQRRSSSSPRSASWELLYQGSAAEFVEALCEDAFAHPAVNHPYLKRLADGDFPDMAAAVRDYCHQYYFYSAQFTAYLEGVIAGLESPAHRKVLIDNLEEERGLGAHANPDHVPHTELFQRFRRAAGVSPEYEAATPACTTALVWRDLFLQKCNSRQPGVGLGAIGIATEMVVSTIYRYLQRAVSKHTAMKPEDYLFLTLHLDCDDGHAADLKQISIELAGRHDTREALRFGVLSSLNLRNAFWDVMLARAVSGAGR
jgi:pyrroloquinoline quinone (PQQ) biosynthesis protein C